MLCENIGCRNAGWQTERENAKLNNDEIFLRSLREAELRARCREEGFKRWWRIQSEEKNRALGLRLS